MTAIMLASSEVRQTEYKAEHSCTSDKPFTTVKKESTIRCATECTSLHCRELNFDDTTKDCSLYKHKPLFYEARPHCSGYKAR